MDESTRKLSVLVPPKVLGLEDLNLEDRFLFNEVMENREAYQAAVSILLEKETQLLEKPETEKELRISPQLRQVRWIKTSERMGVKYMQEWEERALEREEGRREGAADSLIKDVEAVMKNFKLDLEKACEGLEITVEEYHKAKRQYG